MIYEKLAWLGIDFIPTAISYVLSFAALFVGSITDLKTREVPDWLNYGLVISGIGLNLLFSIIYSTPSFIINSIIGLAIFFGIAYIMFYAGQWGGGDSKMLMGLGAMIGIDISSLKSQFLFGFFINALFIGAIYGLFWSFWLAFKNKQKFSKEFNKILLHKNAAMAKRIILLILAVLLIFLFAAKLYYIKILALSLTFVTLATFYLWIFVKAIEKSSMYKSVEPTKLTEGDWIVKDIYVKGKYITGPKDLGISKSQIKKLIEFYKKRKVKKILIKEGIPFVPSFLAAFVITLVFGNFLVLFL
ncbi:prepilin peptidase [Candidatus Woesearchaeota archaeon]|nr:prepilin peptidase [Candidatus Woesearchaeota archaeon]